MGAATDHEHERRCEGDDRRQEPAAHARGCVTDDRDGLDDGTGRYLTQGHGDEELCVRHPVVGRHGVVLHERDDHESAAVGKSPDLEGHPRKCSESSHERCARHKGDHGDRSRCWGPSSDAEGCFDQATAQHGDNEVRADAGGGHRAGGEIHQPSGSDDGNGAGSSPARRCQADGGAECDHGHSRARTGRHPPNPQRGMVRQEQRRQGEDGDEAGHDEADAADHRSHCASYPPCTEDRQLGRGGAGQEVGGRYSVFEFIGRQPASLVDAQCAEEGDVGGWPAKPDEPDATPLTHDSDERDANRDRRRARAQAIRGSSVAATSRLNRIPLGHGQVVVWTPASPTGT